MKNYKIKVGDKQFIVKAQDKFDAVKKLKDAQNKKLCDETLEEKERKAQEWVDYDIKHYGKVSETTKEDIRKMGLDFDKWDKQVKDCDIRDAGIDPKHYAEYGWKIENDLFRDCYWEAVEQLAGKLKTEQDYIREIPKLAKQLFEKYVKEIKNEFEKLVSASRSKTANFDKWAQEQAKNIVEKQGK